MSQSNLKTLVVLEWQQYAKLINKSNQQPVSAAAADEANKLHQSEPQRSLLCLQPLIVLSWEQYQNILLSK
jgi:hypothetical protein